MKGSAKRNIIQIAVIIAVAAVLFFGGRTIKKYVSDNDGERVTTGQSVERNTEKDSEIFTDKNSEPDSSETGSGSETSAEEKSTGESSAATDAQTQQQVFLYNFRRSSYLTEHFNKHGDEFGYKNEQEYLEGANNVIMDRESLYKTEAEDGDHVFFQESTGSIVFVSVDGYIRTYFKPDDGIEYFNRQ